VGLWQRLRVALFGDGAVTRGGEVEDDDDEDSDALMSGQPVQLPIDGELDLHTFRPGEVKGLVPDYIRECRARGILELRIVHGKGKGTLRRTVHAALERLVEVKQFGLAPPERGGWGATLVELHGDDIEVD